MAFGSGFADCPSSYDELRVEFGEGPAGGLGSRVYFPADQSAVPALAPFGVPVQPWEVEAVISTLVVRQSRYTSSETSDPARDIGSRIFDEALGRDGKRLYARGAGVRETQGGVCVTIQAAGPQIDELPWELMYDRHVLNNFVGLAPGMSIVRRGEMRAPARVPRSAARVVVVSPQPQTHPDADQLYRRLKGGGLPVDAVRIFKPRVWEDLPPLLEAELRGAPLLLHLFGSGQAVRRGAQRLPVIRRSGGDGIGAAEFRELAKTLPGLKMITLHGGATDRLALALRDVVPVAAGFRELVSPAAVVTFLREFYPALWAGVPVPAAVAMGRSQVVVESQGGSDWAAPVVTTSTLEPLVEAEATAATGASGTASGIAAEMNGSVPRRADAPDVPDAPELVALSRSVQIDRDNLLALQEQWRSVPEANWPEFVRDLRSSLRERVQSVSAQIDRKRAGA